MCPFLKLSTYHSRSCSLSFSWIHTVVSPDQPVPFFLTSCQPSPPGHVAAWCPFTAGWPRGMYSCTSLREQLLGIHGPHTLEKGIPWGPLSHRPPQINTELVFWSSHAAIKYGWNWPMSSEETWRREVGTLTDGGTGCISVDYLIEISAMVLVQSVFPGGSECLLYPSALPVPGPSSSGCRQGSEGPAQQALLLGSYGGSPSDLISWQS